MCVVPASHSASGRLPKLSSSSQRKGGSETRRCTTWGCSPAEASRADRTEGGGLQASAAPLQQGTQCLWGSRVVLGSVGGGRALWGEHPSSGLLVCVGGRCSLARG